MRFFEYKDHQLQCEEIPVQQIAKKVGTPFYLYSYHTLVRHFTVFDNAFGGIPHLVCYSAKANSNLALIRLFTNLGGGVDVVSGGELYRAIKGGADPKKIVFAGVGKRGDEISLKFLKQAKEHLTDHGKILLLISSLTPIEKIEKFKPKIVGKRKIFFEELRILEFKK